MRTKPNVTVPQLTNDQKKELKKYVVQQREASADSLILKKPFPAQDQGYVVFVQKDTTYMDSRYTPARPTAFKAGWYFHTEEMFDGPYQSEEDARLTAQHTILDWIKYAQQSEHYCFDYYDASYDMM